MSASTDPRSATSDPRLATRPTLPVPRTVPDQGAAPYLQSVDQVVLDTGADLTRGLSHREAARMP